MDPTCGRCRKPRSLHCEACEACPGQECPYWCALSDDPYAGTR